jgi:multidrug efflux pump subunit AcrA (membrane-fusion protein)
MIVLIGGERQCLSACDTLARRANQLAMQNPFVKSRIFGPTECRPQSRPRGTNAANGNGDRVAQGCLHDRKYRLCGYVTADTTAAARRVAAWRPSRRSGIDGIQDARRNYASRISMSHFTARGFSRSHRSRRDASIAGASLLCLATMPALQSALAAGEADAPKGPAVSVLKAAKSCFNNIVEVSGIILPRDETAVRPERPGLKVSDILADAGETVTAGQTLARLTLPEGGSVNVQAPVAGVISASTATIGAMASPRGEALFSIIARAEYDMVGLVPTEDISKLAVNQPAAITIIGAGDIEGKIRRVAPTVEPNSQLGQVFIGITSNRRLAVNSSGRAQIKIGQSCGVAVPLTAVQYSTGGTVVQVVRRQRIETKRVEIGLMSGGQIEIRDGLSEGDDVVARAGALLREGDPVRPVAAASSK